MKKHILDIAPYLADHFIDVEYLPANKPCINEKDRPRIGKYFDYLGLLHDSSIIDARLTSQRFVLQLNDFTTHAFADALVTKKGLDVDDSKRIFRIDLEFENANTSYNIVDEDGFIEEIKPVSIDEYLYEDIISFTDEIIEIALVVWAKGQKGKQGKQILILISAKNVLLMEHQKIDWANIFGNEYDRYYDLFTTELLKRTYLSDQSLCENLIDKIDETVG
jgi:hypothetical protein